MKPTTRSGSGERTTFDAAGLVDQLSPHFPYLREMGVLDHRKPFSLSQRTGTLGPITLLDFTFGVDTWIRCADERPYYQVNVVAAGTMDLVHRGQSIVSGPGLANVCLAEGKLSVSRWSAGSRMIAFRVERNALEDALSEALGRELTTQIAFEPALVTTKGAARTWLRMLTVVAQEVFRSDSALRQPLVATPYAHSLIYSMLVGTEHPHSRILAAPAKYIAPQAIRPAIEIIEAEAHQPLTVASLASRCNISSRTLQQGFLRHTGMSPMTYLRQVRLRRAHEDLLNSDPSVDTVASVANRWGYSNPGRFAGAHTDRYGESPAETLRRSRRTTLQWPNKAPIR
jgi:AraC-like DNA-binding protein